MRAIPKKLRNEMAADPFYSKCSREGLLGHTCDGRITWEHVFIFSGRQVNKIWAIIPLCEKGHSVDHYQDGGDLDKHINEWIALNRATVEELVEVSKARNYVHYRDYLNGIYGLYPVEKYVDSMGERCADPVRIQYEILDRPQFSLV